MESRKQAGFTLVEVLVAAACGCLLLAVLVSTARSIAGWSDRMSARVDAEANLDRLTDRWYADAASAWSIFTPAVDVFGNSNVDGHEFDMATEDALNRPSYLAYCYDASQKTLRKYTYGSPGATPLAAGDDSNAITHFAANTYDAKAIQDPTSSAYDPLFAPSTIVNADLPLNLGPEALAGNRLTQIHIGTKTSDRIITLASATAPSSVTIVLTYTPAP